MFWFFSGLHNFNQLLSQFINHFYDLFQFLPIASIVFFFRVFLTVNSTLTDISKSNCFNFPKKRARLAKFVASSCQNCPKLWEHYPKLFRFRVFNLAWTCSKLSNIRCCQIAFHLVESDESPTIAQSFPQRLSKSANLSTSLILHRIYVRVEMEWNSSVKISGGASTS